MRVGIVFHLFQDRRYRNGIYEFGRIDANVFFHRVCFQDVRTAPQEFGNHAVLCEFLQFRMLDDRTDPDLYFLAFLVKEFAWKYLEFFPWKYIGKTGHFERRT